MKYGKDVYDALSSLENIGKLQFLIFYENRLIKEKEAINDTIKENLLLLPGKATEKDKKEKEKMNYSVTTLTKLREAVHNRPSSTKYLFATEIFNVAQSLAENSETLYHGTKSDVLKCFVAPKELSINKCDYAIMHDLSILVKKQFVDTIKPFSDLSKRLYSRIMEISDGYKRFDIVADRYFQESWEKTDHVFLPEWQDSIDIEVDINIITSTCTCTTSLCRNCKCAKKDIPCLPFCSCRCKCARPKDKQRGNAAYGDTNAV